MMIDDDDADDADDDDDDNDDWWSMMMMMVIYCVTLLLLPNSRITHPGIPLPQINIKLTYIHSISARLWESYGTLSYQQSQWNCNSAHYTQPLISVYESELNIELWNKETMRFEWIDMPHPATPPWRQQILTIARAMNCHGTLVMSPERVRTWKSTQLPRNETCLKLTCNDDISWQDTSCHPVYKLMNDHECTFSTDKSL